jgi:hypothetical protein
MVLDWPKGYGRALHKIEPIVLLREITDVEEVVFPACGDKPKELVINQPLYNPKAPAPTQWVLAFKVAFKSGDE